MDVVWTSKQRRVLTGINDTHQFPDMIKNLPSLPQDEEYVSYDVESLFTNVLLQETIDYIIDEIYVNKKQKPLCSKLIFERLLTKLTTECTFTFNNKFYRQTDGCANGWSFVSYHGRYLHD